MFSVLKTQQMCEVHTGTLPVSAIDLHNWFRHVFEYSRKLYSVCPFLPDELKYHSHIFVKDLNVLIP